MKSGFDLEPVRLHTSHTSMFLYGLVSAWYLLMHMISLQVFTLGCVCAWFQLVCVQQAGIVCHSTNQYQVTG